MHIDNPQMRGLFFCGVTRHVCRGYDRLWILGGPPPRAKQTAGTRERFLRRYSANTPRVRPTAVIRRATAEMHPMTLASSGTPHTKPIAGRRRALAKQGAHSPYTITRIIFGIMDKERTTTVSSNKQRTTTNMYTCGGACVHIIYITLPM
jgi:hypothetical protein